MIVIGLIVGLAVGLTESHRHHHSTWGSSSTSTSSPSSGSSSAPPYPSPTSTPTGPSGVWQPAVNASWQIVLQNAITLDDSASSTTPDVQVWDIDMFDNSNSTISKLHQLGKDVVCYFSAGTYEPGRPDSAQFQDADKGKELDGWPGEYWLNLNSQNVRNIMANRIVTAAGQGCDGIDPDNVDGYNNDNGLGLTQQDSIDFLTFLSGLALSHNLAMGLKNAGEIVPNVLNITQFTVNEQCVQYQECDTWAPYVQAGKPVFHIEYPNGNNMDSTTAASGNSLSSSCTASGANDDFSTVLKDMDLDGWVQFCNGATANTATS